MPHLTPIPHHNYTGQDTKLKIGTEHNTDKYTRITLYNVCSLHRGMFSTSGGVQYIGGIPVHRGDTMSISGGYHEYIGGCSVHRGDIMMNVGDTSGGYHDERGGIP